MPPDREELWTVVQKMKTLRALYPTSARWLGFCSVAMVVALATQVIR
jgi:hypothetical protein